VATTNKTGKQSSRKTTGAKTRSGGGGSTSSGRARSGSSRSAATARRASSRAADGTARRASSKASAATNGSSSNDSLRSKVVRGAVGAVVGGAALEVANLVAHRNSRPKVLGIRIPDELKLQRFDAGKLAGHVDVRRLAKNVDLKDVVRHIGDFAEQVEARSEDVRTLSAQAKRLSRRIT
jgi:hypothetical protein